jgi:hypothetical protein
VNGTFRATARSAAIAGCALLFLNGCSIIGLGVGAGIDAARGIRNPRRLLQTAPGTRVTLKLRDHTVLRGAFAGIDSTARGEPAGRVLPVRGPIGIELGSVTRFVPYDSVSSTKIRGVHSAKTILVWMGLATDVSLLLFGSLGNPSDIF